MEADILRSSVAAERLLRQRLSAAVQDAFDVSRRAEDCAREFAELQEGLLAELTQVFGKGVAPRAGGATLSCAAKRNLGDSVPDSPFVMEVVTGYEKILPCDMASPDQIQMKLLPVTNGNGNGHTHAHDHLVKEEFLMDERDDSTAAPDENGSKYMDASAKSGKRVSWQSDNGKQGEKVEKEQEGEHVDAADMLHHIMSSGCFSVDEEDAVNTIQAKWAHFCKGAMDIFHSTKTVVAETWRTLPDEKPRDMLEVDGVEAAVNALKLSRAANIRERATLVMDGLQNSDASRKVESRSCWNWIQIVMHATAAVARHDFIMPPSCRRRAFLDVLGIVFCLCDVLLFPLQAFEMPMGYKIFKPRLDMMATCFWSTDLLAAFNTGFINNEGELVLKFLPIARRYVRTWFLFDFLICVNDWFSYFTERDGGDQGTSALAEFGKPALRIMRAFRLVRLVKMSKNFNQLMEKIHSEFVLTLFGLCKSLSTIIVICHYVGCIWYTLTQLPALGGGDITWVEKFMSPETDFYFLYLTSLHWAMTQVTPASMEVTPTNIVERLYVCCIILLALVMFSSFVGSITQALAQLRSIREAKLHQECVIRRFFAENGISRELTCSIWHFLRAHELMNSKRMKPEEITSFKLLPKGIRERITVETFRPILTVHPFFEFYSSFDTEGFRSVCQQAISQSTLLPTEEVFWNHVSDVNRMIFVQAGGLDYYPDAYSQSIHVPPGWWCCEEALWTSRPMVCGALAAGPGGAEIVCIIGKDFMSTTRIRKKSRSFLKTYAEVFVESFNEASEDENQLDLLFNGRSRIQSIVEQAARRKTHLKRCQSSLNSGHVDGAEEEEDSDIEPDEAGNPEKKD
eukprot:TRINITY_DN28711_c0_g1_i1.p1 TRINITY_DN28711_c0_g1~~TRINITY_DN28711_c0_g1_i1.p1  ORF type:complete len:854 (+),score=246.35 TRINITY_DN28711_c0_g1_i1:84-2645(+)